MYQETSNSVVWNMLHYEIGMLLYNILKFAFMFQHHIFKIYPLGYVKSSSLQCLTITISTTLLQMGSEVFLGFHYDKRYYYDL